MTLPHPPVGFHFRVTFDLPNSTGEIHFRDVSGLSVEMEEETLHEGGENRFSHKLPVRAQFGSLTLKRGLLKDSEIRKWCERALGSLDIAPTTIWVSVQNDQHEPLQTYTFVNAWPKKWTVSDPNAETSEVLIESIELAYQYFTVS